MNILDIADTGRLHEVIDRWSRVNDPAFRSAAVEEASRFAGANFWLISADQWMRRTAEMVARGLTLQGLTAQSNPGGGRLRQIPDPGRALVVRPHSASSWRYIDDESAAAVGRRGHCDRCTPLRGDPSRPNVFDARIEAVVYIPVDMFVIELALCRTCSDYLGSLAIPVVEQPRILADTDHVEFERSSRLGPQDEPES